MAARSAATLFRCAFESFGIVSSSRPPVKAERGSKSCKQTAREVSLACHYRVAAPKASVGFPEAGTSWDKWASSRHAHQRFDMKPGEPGLAAGCTRHSAASSRGRPPCGASDDLAGPSHECGSAVADGRTKLALRQFSLSRRKPQRRTASSMWSPRGDATWRHARPGSSSEIVIKWNGVGTT